MCLPVDIGLGFVAVHCSPTAIIGVNQDAFVEQSLHDDAKKSRLRLEKAELGGRCWHHCC